MKTKLKFVCLILTLLVMILPVFTSCNSEEPSDSVQTTEKNVPNDIEAPTEEHIDPRLSVADNLPDDLDFGGKNFTILYPTWSMYVDYYFVEELNGDAMNDAIYKRQKNVEERLNVNINYVNKGYIDTIGPEINKAVMAGTDDYQLALTHCIGGIPQLIGNVQNWNIMPYVDFTKPWWNQQMNEELSVQDILLLAVSDLIIFDPNVIYFNKDMIQDFGLETPYDIVKSGKWTWEKLTEMAKQVSTDIDGDGAWTKEDQYGLVTHAEWMMQSAMLGCDLNTVTKATDGELILNLKEPKFGQIIETIFDLTQDRTITYLDEWDANDLSSKYESDLNMNTNRALFITDPLSVGGRYRAYDVEFGILPYPKLNEEQEGYRSLSWNGFMVAPLTADADMVGAVCEALAVESYKHVIPAYYDILLTSKVSRDEESREMIDIIYEGACYDFALNYSNWNELSQAIPNLLKTGNRDYVSYIEKRENAFMRNLQKIYDQIIDNYTN